MQNLSIIDQFSFLKKKKKSRHELTLFQFLTSTILYALWSIVVDRANKVNSVKNASCYNTVKKD